LAPHLEAWRIIAPTSIGLALNRKSPVGNRGLSVRYKKNTIDALIAAALYPFSHAVFVNDRHSAPAIMPDNDIITITCIVMPPIAIMVSYSNAHTNWPNADIGVLGMRRKHDCNSNGRK
jgi:hypothetical protein